MQKIAKILLPVVLIGLVLTGCGGGVSEDKPITEVKTEAQAMSVDQLKATVAKYQEAIASKKDVISKLTAALQKIPVTQTLGDEAKKLKGDISNITSAIRALKERLDIYSEALKNKL
ncbi:MAG: hypothetical protein KAS46_06150 [Candidatus Aureabacteria bacterium]|nr:hypothetical protein [Candidatus Auribacterota bacterium]